MNSKFLDYTPCHNDHRGGELGAYRLLPFQSGTYFIRGYDLDLQDHLCPCGNLRSLSSQLIGRISSLSENN